MTVIEAARELGKAIQADDRYLKLVAAKEANDKDDALNALIALARKGLKKVFALQKSAVGA